MSWWLVLPFLLGAQGFAPAPIRWGGLPARQFVLVPETLSHGASALKAYAFASAKLVILERSGRPTSSEIPFFIAKPDQTIAWDAMGGLCIEAQGDQNGDVIHVSRCTAGRNQQWSFLQFGDGRNNLIQLKDTKKCIDVKLDGNGETSLNGASLELQDCENRATESWTFADTISRAALDFSQHPMHSPAQRHAQVASMLLFLFGALSLTAWLGRWRATQVAAANGQRGMHWNANQGGISLTAPMAMHQDEKKYSNTRRISDVSTAVGSSMPSRRSLDASHGASRRNSGDSMASCDSHPSALDRSDSCPPNDTLELSLSSLVRQIPPTQQGKRCSQAQMFFFQKKDIFEEIFDLWRSAWRETRNKIESRDEVKIGMKFEKETLTQTISRILGPDHPNTIAAKLIAAKEMYIHRNFERAKELQAGVLNSLISTLGSDHPDVLSISADFALTLVCCGDGQEKKQNLALAEEVRRMVYEAKSRILGAFHPEVLAAVDMLRRTQEVVKLPWKGASDFQREIILFGKSAPMDLEPGLDIDSHVQLECDEQGMPVRVFLDTTETETESMRFTYVDEAFCIGCTRCVVEAPNTFRLEEDHGKARVIAHGRDDPEVVAAAIGCCPVDCISDVDLESLIRLEAERDQYACNGLVSMQRAGGARR